MLLLLLHPLCTTTTSPGFPSAFSISYYYALASAQLVPSGIGFCKSWRSISVLSVAFPHCQGPLSLSLSQLHHGAAAGWAAKANVSNHAIQLGVSQTNPTLSLLQLRLQGQWKAAAGYLRLISGFWLYGNLLWLRASNCRHAILGCWRPTTTIILERPTLHYWLLGLG